MSRLLNWLKRQSQLALLWEEREAIVAESSAEDRRSSYSLKGLALTDRLAQSARQIRQLGGHCGFSRCR